MNVLNKLLAKKKLWRTLAVVLLTLAFVFLVVMEVAFQFDSAINSVFKTSNYKTIGGGESGDTNYFPSAFNSVEEVTAYGKAVSEEVEAEGLVLLKNKNATLPLSSGTKVSTVLQNAENFSYGSSGSGKIDASKYTDLKTALTGVGLSVNQTLWDFYAEANDAGNYEQGITFDRKGNPLYKVNTLPWSEYTDAVKSSITTTGGTAIVVVGRLGGEGNDVSTKKSDGYDGSYLSLTKEEIEIFAELTKMKNNKQIDNIVVILNGAAAIQTAFLEDNWTTEIDGTSYTIDVDACMWVGNVGIGGIFAVADALVGTVNPSGRLVDTYVKDNFSSPAIASWILQNSSTGRFATVYEEATATSKEFNSYGVYVEGIYVGYRYYETRYEDVVTGRSNAGSYNYTDVVSRPFGYGLSYTTFEYSNYSVAENEDGDYEVSVTVTNTGSVAGKEVVQVYLQKPYTDYDVQNGVEKAAVELAGFAKTAKLEAGASETVTVTVEKESFKTYDANGYKTYILEEGDYYLATGTSSHDALNNILAQKGKTMADGMDSDGKAALAVKVGDGTTGQKIVLDNTTYATSTESGEEVAITNRLDFCDINKYEGKGNNGVTYVTRNNWNGTFPTEKIVLTETTQMTADLAVNKEIEEEGVTAPSYGVDSGMTLIMLRGAEYDDDMWDALLDQMSWGEQAYVITNSYYGSMGAESISLTQTVATDGPTGSTASVNNISFPSEGIWAASFNVEIINKVGDALAEDARRATNDQGLPVTGLYLPGINIHRTPFGGRAHEYFSEDPYLSGKAVESEIKGVQAKGVIPYVKHFIFNDEEDQRNGIGIWLNEQSAREIYLEPFRYAVSPSYGNSHGLMTSFNRAGCIWTSASSELMIDILRNEFGFDGVVLTDMVSSPAFMTYQDGIMNGTDLYLQSSGSDKELDGFTSVTFRYKVREAVHHYLYVIVNYSAAMNGVDANTRVVRVYNWWQATLIAVVVVFFVLAAVAVVFTTLSYLKENKIIFK